MNEDTNVTADGIVDKEQPYNDPIFSSDGIYVSDSIEDNTHYKRPHVRTWVFTNISHNETDKTYWVKINNIAVPAEYMYKLNNFNPKHGKGVYIITSYKIPASELSTLELLKPIIKNRIDFLPNEECNRLYNIINTSLNQTGFINDLEFRITYFIPKWYYDNHRLVSIGDILTSTRLENLYRSNVRKLITEDNEVGEKIVLELEFFSDGKEPMKLDIDGLTYNIMPVKKKGVDKLHIKAVGIDGYEAASLFDKEIPIDNKEMKLLHEDRTGLVEKIIEHEDKQIDALMKLYQLVTDKKVNLSKIIASENKSYIAKLGMDKAELELAKEGLKSLLALL